MGLFGTSGIRGIYGSEITPELMLKLGLSIASYLKSRGKVLVGGDCRLTTQVLKTSLISGLMAGGLDVVDSGMLPLPVLNYGIVRHSFSGGAYITASHNPPEYNGVKIFDRYGVELRSEDEALIEDIIRSNAYTYSEWCSVGQYSTLDYLIDEYVEELSSRLMPRRNMRKVKVVVDTANCTTSLVSPKILVNLGAEVLTLNSYTDGRFPGREAEPRPDVLAPYLNAVKDLNVDVFLAHDGDGDRLAVVDPLEGFIKQDRLIALLFKYKLLEGGGKVVASIDCGNSVREVVERYGGELIISKLGKIHEALLSHKAVIAAEPWKLIDPSWGYWIDSIYQAGLIVKMMIEEGKTLRQLMEDIPNYPQARYSIKVPTTLKLDLYRCLREYLEREAVGKATTTDIDGFRVDYYDGSWILVRPSGTEPKVRIYGEAKRAGKLKELLDNLLSVCSEFLHSKGVRLEVDGSFIP
ncbi:MAG: hypothetical protein QXT01_01040 [Sulfolobales archaeon]